MSNADAALIDLEDSVATADKPSARRALEAFLTRDRQSFKVQEVHVRVNQSGVGFDEEDLRVAVHPSVSAIRLPKVSDPRAISRCFELIQTLAPGAGCAAQGIRLYLTIESARGLQAAVLGRISAPGVSQLVFATGDFRADLGYLRVLGEGDPTLVPRSLMVIASAAMHLGPPVDGVFSGPEDLGPLRSATQWGVDMGFFGKSLSNENQIEVVHDVLTPSAADVEAALTLKEAGPPLHHGEAAWADRILLLSETFGAWDASA